VSVKRWYVVQSSSIGGMRCRSLTKFFNPLRFPHETFPRFQSSANPDETLPKGRATDERNTKSARRKSTFSPRGDFVAPIKDNCRLSVAEDARMS
jgi:hypothetical protein